MVFAYHAFNARLGWAGVDLFFVLSGYLITGILLRMKQNQTSEGYFTPFYFRRVLRIAPPYLGFLVIVSVLYPIPWHRIWYWYAFFGANLASALGKCPVHAMTPLWSLAVEEQFYFIWPLIVLLVSRKALKRVALGLMVGAPLLRAALTPEIAQPFIYCLTPCRADSLACGALVAIYALEDAEWAERWRSFARATAFGAVTLMLGLSYFHSFRHTSDTELFNILGYSLLVVIFGATLVWTLAMKAGLAFRFLVSRPLRYMGQISYTFYLYHVAFIDKFAQHFRSRAEVGVLAFMVTALFSSSSWHFLESRILKLRPKPQPQTLRTGLA